jgi:hypothetical protein
MEICSKSVPTQNGEIRRLSNPYPLMVCFKIIKLSTENSRSAESKTHGILGASQ